MMSYLEEATMAQRRKYTTPPPVGAATQQINAPQVGQIQPTTTTIRPPTPGQGGQNVLAPQAGQIRQGTPLGKTAVGHTSSSGMGTNYDPYGGLNTYQAPQVVQAPAVAQNQVPTQTPDSQPITPAVPDYGGRKVVTGTMRSFENPNANGELDALAAQQTTPPPVDITPIAPAEDQLTKQMQLRTEQDNLRNTQQARRNAHERAVRAGYAPGSAQYEQMMRNAETDASDQNIAATNKFREFATQREGEVSDRDLREFQALGSFVESTTGQSMLAEVVAKGGNWQEAMGNLYTTDAQGRRVLKPENRDKSANELMRATLQETAKNIFDTEAEQTEWVNDLMRKQAEQGVAGLDITDKTQTLAEGVQTRINTAIESNDYSQMLTEDWTSLDSDQKSTLQGKATAMTDSNNTGDSWRDLDNMTNDSARSTWLSRNEMAKPEMKGKVITYNNKTYVITEPMVIIPEEGNNKRVGTKGIDTATGREVTIKRSSRFEPKAGWNPFD